MCNIKKLCLYCYECVKASGKNDKFLNLADAVKIYTDNETFTADNKQIIDMMMKSKINNTTMAIYKGKLFFKNEKYYTPVIYCECELIRCGDEIKLEKKENYQVNVNLIASLLNNDADIIENVINDLNELENIENLDFNKILSGIVDMSGITLKDENAIILSEMPDNTAGLLNELKKIIKNT